MAVINDDCLIEVVICDNRAGRTGGLNQGIAAAGCIRDGLCLDLILVGEAGVMTVIGSYEQNIDCFGILCSAFALDGDDAFILGNGCAIGVKLIAEPEIVCVVHAVNGEIEAILREVGEAVLIDLNVVESCGIDGVDNIKPIHTVCECFRFGCFEISPNGIELMHSRCFIGNLFDSLSKACCGNERKNHDECKEHCS